MSSSAGYKLRTVAHKHLTDSECTSLKIFIRRFRETQSVLGLCTSLQKFLDFPDKVHIIALIFPMIPAELQGDFDNLCQLQFEHYATLVRPKLMEKYKLGSNKKPSPTKGRERNSSARVLLPVEQLYGIAESRQQTMETFKGRKSDLQRHESRRSTDTRASKEHKRSKTYHAPEEIDGPSTPKAAPNVCPPPPPPPALNVSHTSSESTPRVRLGEQKQTKTPKGLQIRRVTLERREGESFGFCIRGGVDLKSGIFVSEVDPGGQAERKGMKVGERILKVNNIVFKNITHSQAVVAIKSSPKIHVYLAPLGQMPGSVNNTPRNIELTSSQLGSQLGSQLRLPSCETINTEVSKSGVRKVTILAEEDGWLGCSIRGGTDYNMEVSVANVDPLSPADRAGLKKGELIAKVNGVDISGLQHMEIVNLVTSCSIVVLHVKSAPRRQSQSSSVVKKSRGRHPSTASSTGKKSVKECVPQTILEASRTSPRNIRGSKSPIPQTNEEIARFVAEMESTPPVSSSTPLPPEDHPMLISNRNQYLREMFNNSDTEEATIIQMKREAGEDLPPRLNLNFSNRSEADDAVHGSTSQSGDGGSGGGSRLSPRRGHSKFDQGTIRLNMANAADKGALKEAKLINIDIDIDDDVPAHGKQRRHVKDLFKQKQATNMRHSPSPCGSRIRHGDGNLKEEIPDGFTPRMNILSSPYSNYDRERYIKAEALSPTSKDLKRAVRTATSQISHELTGKNPTLTPMNVPPSPHTGTSPVSKFIHKVLRRRSLVKDQGGVNKAGGSNQANSGGSTESLNSGCGGLTLGKMEPQSTLGRTAYDLMKVGRADVSSIDGDY